MPINSCYSKDYCAAAFGGPGVIISDFAIVVATLGFTLTIAMCCCHWLRLGFSASCLLCCFIAWSRGASGLKLESQCW